MTTLRSQHKNGHFVILCKSFLQDKTLSLKAKGLLAYLLSLPDDWKIYINELTVHSTDGTQATRSAIKELIKSGYITFVRKRNVSGTFSQGEYIISEDAKLNLEPCPQVAKPQMENPSVVTDTLLRNNTNKDKIKTTTTNTTAKQEPCGHNSVQDHAAANMNDQFIGKELSANQQHAIRLACIELQPLTGLCVEQLYHSLTASILDKTSFTQAGSDFTRKLNTLKKCIRHGKWIPQAISPLKKNPRPITPEENQAKWLARMRELTGNKDFAPPSTKMSCIEAMQQAKAILGNIKREEC